MPDVFRARVFCLTHPGDREDYEAIRHDVAVDGGRRFRIVSETRNWTREGDHMVALEWVELSDGGERPERW